MNGIIESIYRHAFCYGTFKMEQKTINGAYPIILIEKDIQLNLVPDMHHFWRYICAPDNNFIFIRAV